MSIRRITTLSLAVLCVLILTAIPAFAQNEPPDPHGGFIVNEDFTLKAGEQSDGDLVVINGDVILEGDSIVHGSIVVWNGNADIDGTIKGELVVSNGDIHLGNDALVDGNVICSWACDLQRGEGAQIKGSIVESTPLRHFEFGNGGAFSVPAPLPAPGVPRDSLWGFRLRPMLTWMFEGIHTILAWLVIAIVGGLIALIWPSPTDRVGQTAARYPLQSLGIGLLGAAAAGVLLFGLAITICLSPLALLGALLLSAALLFGWIGLGGLLGKRILNALQVQETEPIWAAGLGTLILTSVVGALSRFLCLAPLGWLASVVLGLAGLGAVILTRFGSTQYAADGSGPESTVTTTAVPPKPEESGALHQSPEGPGDEKNT